MLRSVSIMIFAFFLQVYSSNAMANPMVPTNAVFNCEAKKGPITYYLEVRGRSATLTESQSGATGYDYHLNFGRENLAEGTLFVTPQKNVHLFIYLQQDQSIELTLNISTPSSSRGFETVLFADKCTPVR